MIWIDSVKPDVVYCARNLRPGVCRDVVGLQRLLISRYGIVQSLSVGLREVVEGDLAALNVCLEGMLAPEDAEDL